jgi:hypothetical protein
MDLERQGSRYFKLPDDHGWSNEAPNNRVWQRNGWESFQGGGKQGNCGVESFVATKLLVPENKIFGRGAQDTYGTPCHFVVVIAFLITFDIEHSFGHPGRQLRYVNAVHVKSARC